MSDYLDDELATARGPDGFVRVGPSLQVEGFDTVFAVGDVSTADAKMAGRAGHQAHLVAENIRKLIDGDARSRALRAAPDPRSSCPSDPSSEAANSRTKTSSRRVEMVSAAKGTDLMVDRYRRFSASTAHAPDEGGL